MSTSNAEGPSPAEQSAGTPTPEHSAPLYQRYEVLILAAVVLLGGLMWAFGGPKPPKTACEGPLTVNWGHGCYAMEGTANANHHWCSASGELSITNPTPAPLRADFVMGLYTGYPDTTPVSIILPAGTVREFRVSSEGVSVKVSDVIPPGVSQMKITTTAKRAVAPGDPRELYMRVVNFHILSDGVPIY